MSKKTSSFSESLQELEVIVASLEKGADIDSGVKLYEKGLDLVLKLQKRLGEAENKIKVIRGKFDAESEKVSE